MMIASILFPEIMILVINYFCAIPAFFKYSVFRGFTLYHNFLKASVSEK